MAEQVNQASAIGRDSTARRRAQSLGAEYPVGVSPLWSPDVTYHEVSISQEAVGELQRGDRYGNLYVAVASCGEMAQNSHLLVAPLRIARLIGRPCHECFA